MDISLFRQRQEVLGKPNQPCQVVVSLDATDIPYEHITFRVDTEERLKMLIATSVVGWENIQRDSHLKHCHFLRLRRMHIRPPLFRLFDKFIFNFVDLSLIDHPQPDLIFVFLCCIFQKFWLLKPVLSKQHHTDTPQRVVYSPLCFVCLILCHVNVSSLS